MNSPSFDPEDFLDYFVLAYQDALKDRDYLIFELRFGFDGNNARTLAEVGEIIGVTRQRIGQILERCFRKIRGKGKRNLNKGDFSNPCARLLQMLNELIIPGEAGEEERINKLTETELAHFPDFTHLYPLIFFLLYYSDAKIEALMVKLSEFKKNNLPQLTLSHDDLFAKWMKDVIWPPATKIYSITPSLISNFKKDKEINIFSEGYNGVFYSEKLQCDVHYQSKLELQFYQHLEALSQVILYQAQPFHIKYLNNDIEFNYYPGVFIVLNDGRGIVVDILPSYYMALNINWKKWSALRTFCKENGYGFLISDSRNTFQEIQRKPVPENFKNSLLEALTKGTVNWDQYNSLREKTPVTRAEFTAIVMKYKLHFQFAPFMVGLNHNN